MGPSNRVEFHKEKRQVIGLEWLEAPPRPWVTPSHRGQAEMGLSRAGWHPARSLKSRV